MDITVSCPLDEKTIRATQEVAMFGKSGFRRRMTVSGIITAAAIAVILLGELLMQQVGDHLPGYLFALIGVCVLLQCLPPLLFLVVPRRQLLRSPQLRDGLQNTYHLTEEAVEVRSETSHGYVGESRLPYTMFLRCFETNAYYFLSAERGRMFPIPKGTLSESEIVALRHRILSVSGLRYILCRY